MHHTALLHMDQRGVCHAAVGLLERLPTWKYHIPVLCGGPVCNCVLSDLQSPSHSFLPDIFLQWIYFSFFLVFWQRCHSWQNLDLLFFCVSHHACRQPMIKQCAEIALCMKKRENKKSQEKVTWNDWRTGKRTDVLSVHNSLFSIRLAAKRLWRRRKWPRNSRRSQISDRIKLPRGFCLRPTKTRKDVLCVRHWFYSESDSCRRRCFKCIKSHNIWHSCIMKGPFPTTKTPSSTCIMLFLKLFWESQYVYSIRAIAFGWIHFNKKQAVFFYLI